MEIEDRGASTQPIPELFAYVSIDGNGNEGILSGRIPDMGAVPFVFGYRRIADKFRPLAQDIGSRTGQTIKLVRFTAREDIETIYEQVKQ